MAGRWGIEQTWEAVAIVTASVYGVDAALVRAESRGRGPRPPAGAREPRKVAMFVAVSVAGCDYIDLARHLRLHKDTVCAHCAELRDSLAQDPALEARVDAIIHLVTDRLDGGRLPAAPSSEDVTAQALLRALHARFDRLEALIRRGGLNPTQSGKIEINPTAHETHGNVIPLLGTAAK